jgi:hypothetical protein
MPQLAAGFGSPRHVTCADPTGDLLRPSFGGRPRHKATGGASHCRIAFSASVHGPPGLKLGRADEAGRGAESRTVGGSCPYCVRFFLCPCGTSKDWPSRSGPGEPARLHYAPQARDAAAGGRAPGPRPAPHLAPRPGPRGPWPGLSLQAGGPGSGGSRSSPALRADASDLLATARRVT